MSKPKRGEILLHATMVTAIGAAATYAAACKEKEPAALAAGPCV